MAAVHALAAVAAVANSLPFWIRTNLLVIVAMSFFLSRRDLLLAPRVRLLNLNPDGLWEAVGPHRSFHARVVGSTVVTRWLILLHLKTDGGQIVAILICRDSLDPESFRRLRVHLRCAGNEP